MAKFLNPELVCLSFQRLSSRNSNGKSHLERTSALMYFLSISAAFKHFTTDCLDLNPESFEGKNNRKQIELEFTRLVLLEKSSNGQKQVTELGKIAVGGTIPEKRISSNFFTVPLKKASSQKEPYNYPRRPAPLITMGHTATGIKWGVECHEDWSSNLPFFLTETKGSTPMLDLSIFVCRDCSFDDESTDVISAIKDQIEKRFPQKLADYWISRIEKEKLLARHIEAPFVEQYSYFANICMNGLPPKDYTEMKKAELIQRIKNLEVILFHNGIKF